MDNIRQLLCHYLFFTAEYFCQYLRTISDEKPVTTWFMLGFNSLLVVVRPAAQPGWETVASLNINFHDWLPNLLLQTLIASSPSYSHRSYSHRPEQQSERYTLEAGKPYYMEVSFPCYHEGITHVLHCWPITTTTWNIDLSLKTNGDVNVWS